MRPFISISISSLALPALLLATSVAGRDWPQWRGPDRSGISTESGWLDQWPADGPKAAWRANVGLGFSSFAIAGGRAVTMGHADGKDTVFCFEVETGRIVWKHSYPAELGDKYFDGGTTGTPVIDAGRVYALSRWGDLFCFEAADGKIVWSKNVQKETDARIPDWGFTGAPLIQGDRLLLNVGDAGMALERKTGATLWKSAPKSAGYSTPYPFQAGNDTLAVFGSGQSYVAVHVADGREAWRIRWLTQYGVNAADPILEGNHLFVSSGYGKGAGLFKLGGTEPEPVWKSKALRTQLNAAVLFKGHLYGVDGDTTDNASLKCIEFSSGKEKWVEEGFGSGGVIIVDGRLVAVGGTGELVVAPATPESFKPTARAQVIGGKTWTAPVLSGGRIYCRNSRGDVVCLDVRKR